jgi:hypothetical protein
MPGTGDFLRLSTFSDNVKNMEKKGAYCGILSDILPEMSCYLNTFSILHIVLVGKVG